MPALEQHAYAHQSTLGDAARIALESPLGTDWPPPGCHVVGDLIWGLNAIGLPEPQRIEIAGPLGGLPPGDLWWATVGEIAAGVDGLLERAIARMTELYVGRVVPGVGWLSAVPMVYISGEGGTVKWISTTMRGTLAGTIEEFQFKMDFGNPGADPTLSESGALALAEQLAGLWATVWAVGPSNWPSSVKFTEVGVVEKEQTSPTSADGTGGNLSQAYGTAWFMYPSGTVVSGSSGAVPLPFEVATCVTLATDHRGPSGRGRLYLPPTHINSMIAAGVFSGDYVTACNTLIGLYLESVKTNTPYVPVVVSRRRLILNEIVQTEVGKVPDSQRRRRRSQDEAREVRAVA